MGAGELPASFNSCYHSTFCPTPKRTIVKLAYSSNAYMKQTVEEAIGRIAALGYRGIELMADQPHAWPASTSDEKLAAIRGCLDEHHLEIANINAFMMNAIGDVRHPYWHPSWIEADVAYRRVRVQHTIAAVKMAVKLGASCITTEPGGPLEGRQTWEEAFDTFVSGLNEALICAEDEGVEILVEPEPGLLIENVEQCLELCQRIDSPALGINFDVGHMFCVGEPLPEAIARLAPFTKHYHLEDIAASRVHEHLVPGTGAIDFAPVIQAIADTGYDGWLTVELYPYIDDPDGAGAAAKDYLTPLLR